MINSICYKRKQEHNSYWLQIPDHPCRILVIGGSGFGKTNTFNLVSHQPDTRCW